jgi:hypothetical protein
MLLLTDNCIIVLNIGFDISEYSSFRWLLCFASTWIWYLSIVFRCTPFLCVCVKLPWYFVCSRMRAHLC